MTIDNLTEVQIDKLKNAIYQYENTYLGVKVFDDLPLEEWGIGVEVASLSDYKDTYRVFAPKALCEEGNGFPSGHYCTVPPVFRYCYKEGEYEVQKGGRRYFDHDRSNDISTLLIKL